VATAPGTGSPGRIREPHGIPIAGVVPPPPMADGTLDRHSGLDALIRQSGSAYVNPYWRVVIIRDCFPLA
jgi:hypothetical protein